MDDQDTTKQDNPEFLQKQLVYFLNQRTAALSVKQRNEKLMTRKSAKKWSPKKTARNVRRLTGANTLLEQSTNALEHIVYKLSNRPEKAE